MTDKLNENSGEGKLWVMTINQNNHLTRTIQRGWIDLPEHFTTTNQFRRKKTYFTFTFTGELPAVGRSPTARVCLVLHTLQRELRPVSAVTSDVDRIGGKDEGATKEEENNKFGQNLLCKCCCNLQSDVLLRMFCCAHGATVVQCLCNCALIQFVRIAMVCLGTLVCSSTSEVLCSLSDLTSLSTRNTRSQTPNTTSHFPNSKSWQIQICCTSLYDV